MNKKITSMGIVVVVIGLIIAIIALPKETVEKNLNILIITPIVLVIIVILVGVFSGKEKNFFERKDVGSKSNHKREENSKNKDLIQKRLVLINELKETERQYLKHKIDKQVFDNISNEKNSELINIESEIDSSKKIDLSKSDLKLVEEVSNEKKRVLTGLLEQKQKKVHELKIAEKSYLHRKIDEAAYKRISGDINREIISIESQVKSIHDSEEMVRLKKQLIEGVKEIKKQKKISEQRQKEDLLEEIEEDLYAQLKEAS